MLTITVSACSTAGCANRQARSQYPDFHAEFDIADTRLMSSELQPLLLASAQVLVCSRHSSLKTGWRQR